MSEIDSCDKCGTTYHHSMVLTVKFTFRDGTYCSSCSDDVLLDHLGEKEFKKLQREVLGPEGPTMDDLFDPTRRR